MVAMTNNAPPPLVPAHKIKILVIIELTMLEYKLTITSCLLGVLNISAF